MELDQFELVHRIPIYNNPVTEIKKMVDKIAKKQPNYEIPPILGGDFEGILKLELNDLKEIRILTKKNNDEELLRIKLENEEIERLERIKEEEKRKKDLRIKRIKISLKIIGISIAILLLAWTLFHYWEWVLGGIFLIIAILFPSKSK